MHNPNNINVMIAGVGGASLGTEICKSLNIVEGYTVFGCDVSPTAFGLYAAGFKKTWLVSREHYTQDVLTACLEAKVTILIPGGEQPMTLLSHSRDLFDQAGIKLITNDFQVVNICSNKALTFETLAKYGIPTPATAEVLSIADIQRVGLPCIVKPATGSGGSVSVFFAVSDEEAMLYADFIRRTGGTPIVQEYIDESEGEFTVGVLSTQDQHVIGSIALKRAMDAKLSVAYRGRGGLISSGYSQGLIDDFPDICKQAETIALAIGSRGPLNIQGRVKNGRFLPFEINPRFSASTYLRAMAGFNEIDIFIQHVLGNQTPQKPPIKSGWYLRSLAEQFISQESIK